MDTLRVLSDLRAQRDRIDNAIAALEALNPGQSQVTVRTQTQGQAPKRAATKQARPTRTVSPAVRRKLSEAAKKRWAARRQGSQPKASAKQVASRQTAAKRATAGGLSPAGRKRLSDIMKKRWAERRKMAA
jgi:ribosomal protein L14E/L6E/L27E